MRRRPILRFRPDLERFEAKRLLSAGPSPTRGHVASLEKAPGAAGDVPTQDTGPARTHTSRPVQDGGQRVAAHRHPPIIPGGGFLAFRVTQLPYVLLPPFRQVLVQTRQPVAGRVYNVLYVALKNGTAQTFNASSGFTVRLTNQTHAHAYPILTGAEQWRPGQVIVFYVLTKKYYPVSFVAGGFQFNLGGRSSTLVPGPSGIFLRLPYHPATFAHTLDGIVAFGQGAQLGLGPRFGLPDTAINTFVSAKTRRIDFGGHF
jgi:hypothetical protein